MSPLRRFYDFRKGELPLVGLLFSFFFLVMAVFQILKPLKKGLFVESYGADLELYAKLLNILMAGAAMVIFILLYNRLGRERLIYVLCVFFAVWFLWFSFSLRDPGPFAIWSFYLIGDLETTFLVAAFWAYATDLASVSQAKRLFGAVGAGGVLGGWAGVATAGALLHRFGMEGLLVLSTACVLLIAVVTRTSEYWVRRRRTVPRVPYLRPVEKPRDLGREAGEALQGARLIASSKYLGAIAGILVFYEIASQIMNYQFSRLLEPLTGVLATQTFILEVYFYANLVGVLVQLLLVSFLMRRFGVLPALLILPVTVLATSAAFLTVPTLYVASLFVIADNGLNYSIQQTSREILFAPTTSEEKYKARAFTNMFLHRLAQGIGIAAVIGLGLLEVSIRDLSWLTMVMVLFMAACGIYAGRRFSTRRIVKRELRAA